MKGKLLCRDVGRKAVPDKGRLNRERPVAKALQQWTDSLVFFVHDELGKGNGSVGGQRVGVHGSGVAQL